MSDALIIHIGAGALGLLSGAAAVSAEKGARLHRAAGHVFFVWMLAMSASGAYLAYLKPDMLSVVVGVLTFYLVATAWATVRRGEGAVGAFDAVALIVALAAGAGGLVFGLEAAGSDTGLKDGFPAAIYFAFAAVALLSAALDISVILRGGIAGAQRIARHLWRMCFALFLAVSSFFLGQADMFPEPVREIYLLAIPVVAALLAMAFWLVRVLFTDWYEKA